MPSFTAQVPDLQGAGPIVEIRLAKALASEVASQRGGQEMPSPIAAVAMIDTGAARTVITEDLARQLGANSIGTALISTASSTNMLCYQYRVRLIFPNNVVFETTVVAAPLQGQHIQCLIGRDVPSVGIFIYTGYTNSFSLSF